VCALRAELRDVKAERDAALHQGSRVAEDVAEIARLTACLLRANASMEEVERTGYLRLGAMESELRDLRAAVLAMAQGVHYHSATGAKWAAELREAVEK
jgi:hypothetical protein